MLTCSSDVQSDVHVILSVPLHFSPPFGDTTATLVIAAETPWDRTAEQTTTVNAKTKIIFLTEPKLALHIYTHPRIR
jgi:hypothetical protein